MKPQLGLLALITIVATVSTPLPLNGIAPFSTPQVLAQPVDARKAEAERLLEQGIQQAQTNQFQSATQSWQQALSIYQRIGDRKKARQVLYNLGLAYDALGDYGKSINFYQQSLVIAREIPDRLAESRILNNLGIAYFSIGKYSKALEYYQQRLTIAREIHDEEGEGRTLANLGITYQALGDYRKASEHLQESLAIYQEIGNRDGEGLSLGGLAGVYSSLGDYSKAIEYQQQALILLRQIGNRNGEAAALASLGIAYYSQGDYSKAIEYQQQSLAILREIHELQGEQESLGSLGSVYFSLGDYSKAIEYHQQSLVIAKGRQDRPGEARALGNLGNAYRSLGNFIRAIEYFEQNLAISREIHDRQGEGASLGNLGITYHSLGNYPKAIKYQQQSLTIAREIHDRQGEGASLQNLGATYLVSSDYIKAIKHFQQSLTIAREIHDRQGESESLGNLGNSLFRAGNLPAAEKTLFSSIKVWESLRLRLDDTNKVSFFETQVKDYRLLQQVLIAQSKAKAALEIAERGRTRAFVELLASRLSPQSSAQSAINPPTAQQLQQIAKAQNATLIEYSIIYDDFKILGKKEFRESELYIWIIKPTGEAAFRRVDLTPLWQKENTSLTQLVPNSPSVVPATPNSSTVVTPTPELGQEITTPWKHPIVIVLFILSTSSVIGLSIWSGQFFLTRKATSDVGGEEKNLLVPPIIGGLGGLIPKFYTLKPRWLVPSSLLLLAAGSSGGLFFLMTQNQPIVENRNVKNDSLLAQLVSDTRDSIETKKRGLGIVPKGQKTSQTNHLKQLHKILIDPIADLLPTEPNARVIFIPQSSLFLVPFPALQDADGNYLIEKHTILTAPSIQVLDLTRKQGQRVGAQSFAPSQGKNALIVGNPTMPSVPPFPGEPPQQLPSLPGAEQEAKSIAKLLNTQAITGNQAAKSAILKKMPSARIIHLATHGILDEQRGLGSAIALAPNPNSQNKIGEVNGLLTAEEILDLKLNASLVVLSACDTGRGRITGDGVVGLSRSLISAGVPSVLVSLWSVPDAPTAFLMTEFYRNWQHNPDKAQALRQAMLTTMKQHPNPRDWAAFTLIGEAE